MYAIVYHYLKTMATDGNLLLPKLPRGPHQLSRETVEQSQRNRILLAVTESVAEKGWVGASVADIVARAGVSRSTFYTFFEDRLECFLAANEIAYELLMASMRQRVTELETERSLRFEERISTLLAAYLETLTSNPGFARVFLVEVYAAGPEAIEQRRKAFDEFVELFLSGQPQVSEQDRVMTEFVVAAVSSFVTNAVAADDIDSLSGLHAQVMAVVERLAPFRG